MKISLLFICLIVILIFFFQNQKTIPVYVSLTSIYKNQSILLKTLKSIINQTRKPNKIFLYLSEEPKILDTGFKNKKITNENLLNFCNNNSLIEIKWVKNIGSYRKLIPLLKQKWNEDCIIITIDDDTYYDKNLIKNLVNDYYKYKCVIGYRGFTPLSNNLNDFDYNKRSPIKKELSLLNFLTGKGGILYKPDFFYKTKNLIFNEEIFTNICFKQDDLWFYVIRILNNVKCYLGDKKFQIKDFSKKGLFIHYNSHNNLNTKVIKKIIKKLNLS